METGAHCPNCGTQTSLAMNFCPNCATSLQADNHLTTQNRILTLVFADIVSSTKFAAATDPETYSDSLMLFHDVVQATVLSYSGQVLQAYGDGLLACFGQDSHQRDGEDAAIAGVAAGLSLIKRLKVVLPDLEVRVGVHSGPVMSHAQNARQNRPTVSGFHANLAAHLQAAAQPGSVVISGATRNFISRLVRAEYDRSGYLNEPGITEPIAFSQVSKFEFTNLLGRNTSVIEREKHIATIVNREFETDKTAGFGIIGSAGLGKSTLLARLEQIFAPNNPAFSMTCRMNLERRPFYPIIDAVKRYFQLDKTPTLTSVQDAWTALGIIIDPLSVKIIAELLDVPNITLPATSPEQILLRRTNGLVELLAAICEKNAGPLILDDLQWSDQYSLNVIKKLVERPNAPCVIITGRPVPAVFDFVLELGLTRIDLPPLSTDGAAHLLEFHSELTPAQKDAIIMRAEGNPLFILALAEHVQAHHDQWTNLELPTTIEATLQSNIDGLGRMKSTVQFASIIGRHFSIDHLKLLADRTPEIDENIENLLKNGIFQQDKSGYRFSHALIHDAAYNMLSNKAKRALHQKLAQGLRLQDPEFCANYPELLANHYFISQDWENYREMALAAGMLSLGRADFDNAIKCLSEMIGVGQKFSNTPEQNLAANLTAQTLLCSAQVQKFGFAHPVVLQGYKELERQTENLQGFPEQKIYALYGLFAHKTVQGDLFSASRLARRMHKVADQTGSISHILSLVNETACGLYMGRFQRAIKAANTLKQEYDPNLHSTLFLEIGADPLISVFSAEVHIHAQQGNTSQAIEALNFALNHQAKIGANLQEPWIRCFSGLALAFTNETDRAHVELAKGIEIADVQGAQFWSLVGRLFQGVMLIFQGHYKAGATLLNSLMPQAQAVGVQNNFPLYHAALAVVAMSEQSFDKASDHLNWSVRRIAQFGEAKWAPLIWKIKQELELRSNNHLGARNALEISQAYSRRANSQVWQEFNLAQVLKERVEI